MKNRTGILLLFLALAPLTVHAQKIFMCKDASGRTLTSDRPIPECADRAVREMDSNGMVRREIPPPPTAEQKRQKQLEEDKRKADEAAAAEQKQNDRAIMARYQSENDIAAARKRTVDLVQEQIKRETVALADAEKRRKDAQTEIDLPKNKKAPPPALKRRLEEADQAVKAEQKKMLDYEAEAEQINAKFDATLKRYRQLSGATAAK